MADLYRDYFEIDPEYFPQVNAAIIDQQPNLWKKFYPHETFVSLIKNTISVLSRRQKVSIWVEGAYGTGKSHAVLTLKKLLDASEEDTKAYFDKYPDQLSNDLYNQFQNIKSGENKILTVHRYGSSSIYGDSSLVAAIQDSIINALNESGMERIAQGTLKDAAIKWLSQEWARDAFDKLLKTEYTDLFEGDDVDGVIKKLNTYSGESLQEIMTKIMKVGDEKQFKALTLDVDGLVEWIQVVIQENNLKAIVFIWDEFTEYFKNNMRALTGFQKIADMSGSDPFYLLLVTHNIMHLFPETDKEWKKILGRFISPICEIELPENMAFRLMGTAMEKSSDPVISAEWSETCDELYERTHDSRALVKNKARIDDNELKNILPIHPYAALLLKHISSAFDSNQRSMFDFIKNDRGDEIKGFQWFIDNYGPFDENPLLTIDMLWDFFYEKGKEFLTPSIRTILDSYGLSTSKQLNRDEKRVLKTVLLLQAISQQTGDSVDLFIPNEKNLNNAFEGSDIDNGAASRIASGMIPDVLFKRPMGGGKFQFASALVNAGNVAEIDKQKEEQKKKPTSSLIAMAEMESAIPLNGALKLRYKVDYATAADFRPKINTLRNRESDIGNKILSLVTFAKDDEESATIGRYIKEALADSSYNIVFIDASVTPLGTDMFEQYVEAMANSVVNLKQDKSLAAQYETNAKDVLKRWKNKIADGEFVIYTQEDTEGKRVVKVDGVYSELSAINRKKYPDSLETGGSVTDTMWQATALPTGIECGINRSTSGQYKSSNSQTKLENYIGDAWEQERYWEKNPHTFISRLKVYVDSVIEKKFKEEGRISIADVYDSLKIAPYGFMPCNLTAFIMGFLLKEYANDAYSWTDGMSSDVMSVAKMKETIAEIIKHNMTPIPRYKNKYIVTMTKEEKAFNEASAVIFGIDKNACTSIEQTRERIRQKMKELSFPVWCVQSIITGMSLKTDASVINEVIDLYGGIANVNNMGQSKTETDIAIRIGELSIENDFLVEDLASLVTCENCIEGMKKYIADYEDGKLIDLSIEIGDDGQYINCLKKKFDADAANWVWNKDTANHKISEVILEYEIVSESNKYIPKNISFDNTIHEWMERCNQIKISFQYAKNYWEELSQLMEILYETKRLGQFMEQRKQKFLEQIRLNGAAFNEFYINQTVIFSKSCSYILAQLTEEDIPEVLKKIPTGMFTQEKRSYQTTVENTVKKYIEEQGSAKLKKLWKDKSGSESPREWSKENLTPILCMVPEKDVQLARQVFDTIGRRQIDKSAVDRAIEFLGNATFWNKMADKNARDEAFSRIIIKSYNTLLDNVDEVRKHINESVTAEPYDWFGLPEIDKKLEQMAQYKYTESGCDKAIEKINAMDIADVKRYLTDLIKDNMTVGMEIIKDN